MKKCICGHSFRKHGLYINEGRNAKHSRFVCQQDGCNLWSYCDLPDELIKQKQEEQEAND